MITTKLNKEQQKRLKKLIPENTERKVALEDYVKEDNTK